jgi:hypothetical protein
MPRNSPEDPAEQGSSFWRDQAAATGWCVFPIRISFNPAKSKWEKHPLTAHGHLDASRDVTRFDWDGANGFGIRTGEFAHGCGIYVIDIDDPAPDGPPARWLARWGLTYPTYSVKTVSGGTHLYYALPSAYSRLPSRANIVAKLDARGEGGWVAQGEGYTALNDLAPAMLPGAVCGELQAGWKGGGPGGTGGPVELGPLEPVDAEAVMMKLTLAMGQNKTLTRRWYGQRPPRAERTIDTSLSAMDHSMAKLLAIGGMSEAEIVWLLTHNFEHGVVRRDGLNAKTERAIRRSAAVVSGQMKAEREALEAALNTKAEYSAEDLAEVEAMLFGAPK